MLLYQSDKTESFVVLGLEGGSIILHFASVYLEGSCTTFCGFLFHCIPLIPFFVSIGLVFFYLRQGGVCYLVEDELFLFTGCEICPNGYPPQDNLCFVNGTNFTVEDGSLFDLDFSSGNLNDLKDGLLRRTEQGTYCGNELDTGPDVNFCFFSY